MKNNFNEKTIGEVVSALPSSAEVFKKYSIDYCCGGGRQLSKVIAEQQLDENEIYNALDRLLVKSSRYTGTTDFSKLKREELSSHIEVRHHSYLREALPQIGSLLGAVLKAHGKNHPEVFELHRVFSRLRGDLEQHLVKEETMLFPAINGAISAEAARLSKQIKAEHEEAGKALKDIRRITNDFKLPQDACATYEKLYVLLEDMEDDLHQHIHLENNILLKDI